MSRICEEFGCLPSEALRELEDDPQRLVLDVMELRAYARAKAALDNAKEPGDMPTGLMAEIVAENTERVIRARWGQGSGA